MQISIPGGVPLGTVETGTVRVTGNGTGATDAVTDVTTIVAGNLVLVKSVNPAGAQLPGTELTYRTDYSNVGTADLTAIVVYDAIPAWTQYRVGSASQGTLAAGITAIAIEFSNDGGATWTYAPVSGGGGAPANFDANVTNVRWTLTGNARRRQRHGRRRRLHSEDRRRISGSRRYRGGARRVAPPRTIFQSRRCKKRRDAKLNMNPRGGTKPRTGGWFVETDRPLVRFLEGKG